MDHRLPRTIIPSNYVITLEPDLERNSFTGEVTITADVVEPTAEIRCNSIDLEIGSVLVDGENYEPTLDPENEQLAIDLGEERSAGPIELTIEFVGTLNDDLRGFYRSTFIDEAGEEQTIGTTQFQSTDARRAFPCWDEPDMKATFDVTLVVDEDLLAVSNGAEVAREPRDDGKHVVTFDRTMKMSTYLVAFVVGPLEATEPLMAGDVPVRIVHRPGQAHLTPFALEVAAHALEFYEDYYGIAYPADKLDMIALPDFAMGAMENLGCVTYREILLLVDPDKATQPELQNVADVINHELAHMWFGDLVTMRWWNGIWLNEAFATFMEMKCTDHFRPEWKRWTSFGISRSAAFDIDSLEATRPIEFPVVSPADAEAMFDLLTYEKGAAVVRMLEQWLGEEVFRDGIRYYLDKHAYANTETHDLWDALEHVAGRPVTEAMETWIFQGGYPVIEVEDGHVHQCRFSYHEDTPAGTWSVPIQVRTDDGEVTLVELHEERAPIDLDLTKVETFNHQGSGFYRVKLGSSALAVLGEQGVAHLNPVERFGLVDDTWSLTLGGDVALEDYMALVEGYASEDDVSVWQRVIGSLSFIDHVASDDVRPALGHHIMELTASARAALGAAAVPGESPRDAQLRGALFAAAGTLSPERSDVRAETVDQARSYLESGDEVDAELLSAAMKVVAANGTEDDFNRFRSAFENASSPQTEIRNLYALPSFPGVEQIDIVTDMAVSGEIRSQNAPFVLARGMMNRAHGQRVWHKITQNWDDINERFPTSTIVRMLEGVRWLTDEETASDVQAFFADRPIPQGQKQMDQHLERLSVNVSFQKTVQRDLPGIIAD